MRKLYEATATVSGTTVALRPKRGAWLTTIDASGDVVADSVRDASCSLYSNIGDRLILAGRTIAETAMVEVAAINPASLELSCALVCGELAASTENVFVLPANRAGRRRT